MVCVIIPRNRPPALGTKNTITLRASARMRFFARRNIVTIALTNFFFHLLLRGTRQLMYMKKLNSVFTAVGTCLATRRHMPHIFARMAFASASCKIFLTAGSANSHRILLTFFVVPKLLKDPIMSVTQSASPTQAKAAPRLLPHHP